MKWITEISIKNYRAFSSGEKIQIPFGSHLLLYGENGSGKSSVYSAVKDFFISTNFPSKELFLNHFEKLKGNQIGSIKLVITDSVDPPVITDYTYANPNTSSNHHYVPELLLANKIKGFLDYKRLLRTYYLELSEDKNPNLFDLLVEEVLTEHLITPIIGSGVSSKELSKQWEAIKTPLQKGKYDGRKSDSKTAIANLPKFETELKQLLKNVFTKFNSFVNEYFDKKLDINVNVSKIEFDADDIFINRGVYLDIKYAGEKITSYQHFLNEARLSALASCIYLAALKTYPIDDTFEIRPLFLDDVFIGLDTNNRIPLLKLIQKEFIQIGYQLFVSTYDIQWFELIKQWFTEQNIKVHCLEMFTESDDNPLTPDKPILLPSNGLLEKAEAHFKAKDYPAAGNYLRKECENIIWNLLPETYRIDYNGTPIQGLELLIHQLEKLYTESNQSFPQSLINSLKIYRKIILNPSSHNDLECPFFRKEIEEARNLVKELQKIPKIKRTKILDKNDILKVQFLAQQYEMEINPADNVFSCELNSVKTFSHNPQKFFIKKWTMSGVEFGILDSGVVIRMNQNQIDQILDQKRELFQVFDGICRALSITMPPDLASLVIVNPTHTLKELIS